MSVLDCVWLPPPAELVLSNDEIHLWRVFLDQLTTSCQALTEILSVDERARADRFYFERDRIRFIVGRSLLRKILGKYLEIEPSQLEFSYGSRGKPALTVTLQGSVVHFNLSHSQGLALYAISRDRRVGIDIEYIRPLDKVEQLVKRFFSSRENLEFQALPPNHQQAAFFKGWTCKEAYLKATGEGLAGSLDQIDISLTPGKSPQLMSINGSPESAEGWSLQQLNPEPGYVAAVAVEGHSGPLSCWQWSE